MLQDNPYHNRTHAADVLQTMHMLLRRGGLTPGYADPLTQVACLLAAVSEGWAGPGSPTAAFRLGPCCLSGLPQKRNACCFPALPTPFGP